MPRPLVQWSYAGWLWHQVPRPATLLFPCPLTMPHPAGCLAALECLSLRSNSLVALPPVLPGALSKLVLDHDRQLALSEADVDRLLALPRLVELSMHGTAIPHAVLQRWQPLARLGRGYGKQHVD